MRGLLDTCASVRPTSRRALKKKKKKPPGRFVCVLKTRRNVNRLTPGRKTRAMFENVPLPLEASEPPRQSRSPMFGRG
eukprot:2797401-Prymnesium_polylepis.1